MRTVRHTLRTALRAGVVAGVVGLGLIAQAGGYLLGYTAPASADAPREASSPETLSHAAHGPHPVGVSRLDEGAPVPMTVWYPAAASSDAEPAVRYAYSLTVVAHTTATALATYPGIARQDATAELPDGPAPAVVLSAGFAITPESYGWLAEHLASYGLVVLAPRHAETLDPSTLWRAAIDRPRVMAETLAYLDSESAPGGNLAPLIDPERVAVLGHSYGGYTALATGGARLDQEAFTAGCDNARRAGDPIVFLCDALEPSFAEVVEHEAPETRPVDAVVSLAGDAAMFGTEGMAGLTAPLMVIGGTADHDSPYAWSTALAYDGASSERRVEVALEGAAHFVFTGECGSARRVVSLVPMGFCEDPGWERAEARAVVSHYVTAFLLSELLHDAEASAALADDNPPPSVRIRSTAR